METSQKETDMFVYVRRNDGKVIRVFRPNLGRGAETFEADFDWEYTDEWYDSALPKIAKRVNEELIADTEMDGEMYSLYEDELFDGDSQTLIPYVDNALKIEYPELTKYQRDEIINEGSMVSELSYSYDFNAENFESQSAQTKVKPSLKSIGILLGLGAIAAVAAPENLKKMFKR